MRHLLPHTTAHPHLPVGPSHGGGFSLLEVLIAMGIVSVGLLGLGSLMSRIHISELESYQRTQALILLSDVTERLNVNRTTLSCFNFTTNLVSGTPFIGATGPGWALPPGCAASPLAVYNTQADNTINALNNQLQGMVESKNGTATGSMVGARLCISYNPVNVLNDSNGVPILGTGSYTITVAWQGMVATQAPTDACGNGLYGAETTRRAVSKTLRFASLNAT